METPDSMLHNCMFWLTEISVYRYRINGMKKQMQKIKSSLLSDENLNKQYSPIIQLIQIANTKLHLTESKIIFIIKKHTNSVSYDRREGTRHLLANEEELFDNMKYFYNRFIELQRAIDKFLKEESAQNSATKVIQLTNINGLHEKYKTNQPKHIQ